MTTVSVVETSAPTDTAPSSVDAGRSWSVVKATRLIRWYQTLVEGRPSPCRFTPSCSSYAHEAFVVHGSGRGAWLTVRRLVRCRPFGPSGFDPVPERDALEIDVPGDNAPDDIVVDVGATTPIRSKES